MRARDAIAPVGGHAKRARVPYNVALVVGGMLITPSHFPRGSELRRKASISSGRA